MLKKLPNIITFFRIATLPFLAWLIEQDMHVAATSVFILSAVSDFWDGYLARRYNASTNLGKLLDPAADKMLLVVSLFFLTANDVRALSPWLASLMMLREFLVSSLRSFMASKGIVVSAIKTAKLKTAFQFIAIGFLIFHYSLSIGNLNIEVQKIGLLLLSAALFFSYYSLIEYLKIFWKHR